MTTTEQAYFGYEKRLEERLRTLNIYLDGKWEHPSVCSEAADEIKRLTILNAELVAALEEAEIYFGDAWPDKIRGMISAALAKVRETKNV